MINKKLKKVVQYICSVHPNIPEVEYEARVYALYGAIEQVQSITEGMLREITMVEQSLLKEGSGWSGYQSPETEQVIEECSKAAFSMARISLLEQERFSIALPMKTAFKTLVSSFLSPTAKDAKKTMISETLLDFGFAAGNRRIASLRMAPIIRSTRNE